MEQHGQGKKPAGPATVRDLVIPNPKLKLMDQVREVLRIKHYATGCFRLRRTRGLKSTPTIGHHYVVSLGRPCRALARLPSERPPTAPGAPAVT